MNNYKKKDNLCYRNIVDYNNKGLKYYKKEICSKRECTK